MSIQGDKFKAVADAIREKDGTTELIVANDFADRIRAISISEDLTTELNTQDGLLANLETEINNLPSLSDGETTDRYFVKVIDYDGTVLKEANLSTGDTFTLPNAPSHDGLVFQEWSCSQDIVDNTITVTDNNVMVGAVYTTASGLNEFDIELTKATGLDVTLKMDGTKDWGDGTTDDLTTHTYTAYGKYTIKCNGTTMTTSKASGLFGQGSSVLNYCYISVRLNNVTRIRSYALNYCYSLKSVVIPNGITSISDYAFAYCYSLTSVIIPNSVTSIGTSEVFRYCYSLKSVVIPNGVTSINTKSFYSCHSLTNIVIPNSVTSIGDSAFYYCYSLTNVVIPNSVISLDNSAFYYCHTLTNVVIPNSVISLGANVLNGCFSLTNIEIPNSVTSIGANAFAYCYSLTSIEIPSSVTSMGSGVFQNCYSLTSIEIPNTVTSLGGDSVFARCHSLKSVAISNNATSLGNSEFVNCFSLTNIEIPNSVTSISNNVFSYCYSITTYDFSKHTLVPTLSNTNAFGGINKTAKIIVPDALYGEWIVATNWATYANYIYKASEVQV